MGCSCDSECTGFCAKGLKKKNLLLVEELPEVSSHEELTDSDLVRLRSQVSEFLVAKGGQVGSILTGDPGYTTCDCPRKSVSFAEKICIHRQQSANRKQATSLANKKKTSDEELPQCYTMPTKKDPRSLGQKCC
ncbi:UNVERIFIED_CONTAM: hypothetical protein GTU68_021887 [Idotea baltica]|nr:hypothetical protein [Idotea baltica]